MSLNRELQNFLGAFGGTMNIAGNFARIKSYKDARRAKNDPTNPATQAGQWANAQAAAPAAPAVPGVSGGNPVQPVPMSFSPGSAVGGGGQFDPAVSDVDPSDQVTSDVAGGDDSYAGGGDVELPAYVDPAQSEQMPPFDPNAPSREPPIPLPPQRPAPTGSAVDTSAGNPLKAHDDQTRTAAFDPSVEGPPATGAVPAAGMAAPAPAVPTQQTPASAMTGAPSDKGLSTNNARSDLENALHGAMTFAQDTFHLRDANDPHHEGGKQALFSGVGAASPDVVKQMDQKVNANVPADPQLYAVRRLEAIYRWYSMNGKTAEANKAAFELVQFTAGVAAQWGDRAAKQMQAGDVPGAIKSVQEGYNYIPDGRHMQVQGNTATIVDSRTGQPIQQFQFSPQQVFGAAMGLSNRSLYWQVLAQRASAGGTKASNRTDSQQDLDRARAENVRARTAKLKAGPAAGGGHSAVFTDLVNKINAEEPDAGNATGPKGSPPPLPAAPAGSSDGADGGEPEGQPGTASGEATADLDTADQPVTSAGPSLTPAPQSVLRTQPPAANQGTPAPADADYKAWLQKNNLRESPDYDMKGAFTAGEQPDERGHMTDRFKKPTHPTFSDESIYADDKNKGGHWAQTGDGKWSFAPGPANLKNGGIERVRAYLKENDPDVTLLAPTGGKDQAPERIPASGDHPGFEPHYETPDRVPDIKIAHDGEKYVPGSDVTPAGQFTEEAPKPNPYRKYEADAAKVPGKEGVALRQLIQKKASAYDASVKTYTARKKAFDQGEKQRVAGETKAAGADLKKAMSAYDQSFKPHELEKAEKDVGDAWDEAAKKAIYPAGQSFDDPGSSDAKAAAAANKPNFDASIFGDKTVSAQKLKSVATSLLTSNPNMTPEKAVRLVYQLSAIDPQDATKRTYKPVGTDVTASKNVVVAPAEGGPHKFAPVHIRPDAYADLTGIVQQRLKAAASRGKQAAETATTEPGDKDMPLTDRLGSASGRVVQQAGKVAAETPSYIAGNTPRGGLTGDVLRIGKNVGKAAVLAPIRVGQAARDYAERTIKGAVDTGQAFHPEDTLRP